MVNKNTTDQNKKGLINISQLNIQSDQRAKNKYNSMDIPDDLESPKFIQTSN